MDIVLTSTLQETRTMKRILFSRLPSTLLRILSQQNIVSIVVLLWLVALFTLIVGSASAQERGSVSGSLRLASTTSTLTGMLGGVQLRFVSTTDASVITTRTNFNGTFALANVTVGTYILTPIQADAAFFPNSTTITISTQEIAQVTFSFVPPLPRITGQIISAGSALPFPFAFVNINGGGVQFSVPVDALGRINVPVSTIGTYTVTPTTSSLRSSFAISPRFASTQVDTDGSVSDLPTFQAFLPQYRIRGIVRTLPGEMISGSAAIRIEELSTTNTVNNTLTTSAVVSVDGGEYVVSVTNGNYRVTVVYGSGIPLVYTISPNPQFIGVTDANVEAPIVTITNRRYQIRGRLITTNGALVIPLSQVPIRIEQIGTNQSIGNTLTDANGNFTLLVDAARFTGVQLRLFITLNGFTFVNNGVAFDNVLPIDGLRDDVFLDNIIAVRIPDRQFPVIGQVLYPNRQPVQAPITAIVTNANSVVPITREVNVTLNADGRYTIPGVTSGTFKISLRAPNLVFSPSIIEIILPRDAGTEFTFSATMTPITINGQIQTVLGEPVQGVQIRTSAGSNTVTSDIFGRYTIQVSGQYPGSRWVIFPTLQGSTFFPPNRLVVSSLSQLALGAMDFRATSTTNTLPLSTVSGKITIFGDDGRERGLGGVLLSDGTRTAVSDINGNYILRDVPNGTYTITPTLDGYTFTPTSLQASIIGGNTTRNQNFVTRLRADATNRPPSVQTPINDIPVIAAATTPIPLASVFADVNGDSLSLTTIVEDPTLLRTRIRDNMLMIDALSEGNTMVSIIANDNRGGTTTASFRVFVSRPFATPRLFVRPKGNLNTNINAAIVIDQQAAIALAGLPPAAEKGAASLTSLSGELGAFNRNCECVGSIVWNGNNAVLPVWGEDVENDVPGMKPTDQIHIRFIDNIERRSRRTRAMYLYNIPPGIWPVDRAIATNIFPEGEDPCQPVQNVIMSAQTERQLQGASIIPNPVASNKALVSYTLPSAGMVNIELWNILGQRVTIIASTFQASGEQQIDFNVEDLPTGMYICRIHSRSEGSAIRSVATIRLSIIR